MKLALYLAFSYFLMFLLPLSVFAAPPYSDPTNTNPDHNSAPENSHLTPRIIRAQRNLRPPYLSPLQDNSVDRAQTPVAHRAATPPTHFRRPPTRRGVLPALYPPSQYPGIMTLYLTPVAGCEPWSIRLIPAIDVLGADRTSLSPDSTTSPQAARNMALNDLTEAVAVQASESYASIESTYYPELSQFLDRFDLSRLPLVEEIRYASLTNGYFGSAAEFLLNRLTHYEEVQQTRRYFLPNFDVAQNIVAFLYQVTMSLDLPTMGTETNTVILHLSNNYSGLFHFLKHYLETNKEREDNLKNGLAILIHSYYFSGFAWLANNATHPLSRLSSR